MKHCRSHAEHGPQPSARRCHRAAFGVRALTVSALLTLGAAQAQSAALNEEVCALPRTFVDTAVNGAARGGSLLLIRGAERWISAELLRDSEAAYEVQRVQCSDGTFVLLNPLLDVTFDAAELTLDVHTRLDLLPGNVLDLTPSPQARAATETELPVTSFGVRVFGQRVPGVDGAFSSSGSLVQSVGVRASHQTGRVALSAEASEGGRIADPRLSITARGSYDVSDQLGLGVVIYGASLEGTGQRFGVSEERISGLEARLGETRAYRIPVLSFDLSLDSDILVSVNGAAGQSFRARAGVLTLKNIPVSSPVGIVSVTVQNASGTQLVERKYEVADVTVTARSLAVLGHAGVLGQASGQSQPADASPTAQKLSPAADLTGVYGLSDTWSLGGQVLLSRGLNRAQLSLRYADARLGAGLSADYDSARLDTLALNADASYAWLNWRLAAALRAPVQNLGLSQVSAKASLRAGRSDFGAQLRTTPGTGAYDLGATLNYRVDERFSVGADAAYNMTPGQAPGWRATARLSWTPLPKLTVAAQAGVTGAQGTSPTPVASTQLAYQIMPGRVVSGAFAYSGGQPSGSVQYSENREIAANFSASTQGDLALSADIGVSLVGSRLFLTRSDVGAGVLIRTGVPNLPLIVGTRSVNTDASGEALVILGEGVREVSLVPDFDHIPLTVKVQDDRRDVTLARHGVTVVDWKDNFEQQQWVRLQWANGQPTKYAQFSVGAQRYTTDDSGYVLIKKLQAPATVAVQADPEDKNPQRQCQLTLNPATETQQCVELP